jgi:hypothetical protein
MPSIMSTRLESLTNELLLEIMEYLDGYNLILAFDGLNHRFNCLVRSCYLHVVFDESKRDSNIWKRLISFIGGSRIRSLSFNKSDQSIVKQFLPTIGQNLKSISLQNISKPSMQFILEHLPVGNQVKSLFIKNCWFQVNPEDRNIENFIFNEHGHRLTSLINCSLLLMPYTSSFPPVTIILKHLRCLSLNDSRWTSNTIMFLLNNTPNLRKLRIRPYGNFSEALSPTKVYLNHIEKLEILLKNDTPHLPSLLVLFSGLRFLRIVYYELNSYPTLDGQAWDKVIEEYLPCLQRMTLDFFDEEDNRIDEEFLNTFRKGKFWSNRQIFTKTVINQDVSPDPMVKRIYFGKPWTFDTDIQL